MFVRLVMGHTSPNPKEEPGPPRVERGLPRSSSPHPKATQGPPRLPRRRQQRAPPRQRATNGIITPKITGVATGRAPSATPGTSKTCPLAEALRPRGRDRAPSDMVRSQSASRSVQVLLPPTPAEALARAQLLLDFPPTTGKLDEWRATIRSLVAVANKDEPSTVGPPVEAPMESRRPVAEKPAAPRPWCIHLFPIRYRGRRLVATSRATTSP